MPKPLLTSDYLDRAVTVFSDRVAVVDESEQPATPWSDLTYRELWERARSHAAALDRMGLDVGDRVAVISPNSARAFSTFFGISGWGRVIVPVNPRLTPADVRYIVEHSGAKLALVDPEISPLIEGIVDRPVLTFGEDDDRIWADGGEPRDWAGDESATATINYTSGTTSRPKGVQLSHRSLWLNAAVMGWETSVNDRDVYLHSIQNFHGHGWGFIYSATQVGGLHVMLRRFDGAEVLRRIEKFGVTLLGAAPAMIAMILDAAEQWTGDIPGKDRVRVLVGGAPMPDRIVERVRAELGWEFMQGYGQSESTAIFTLNRMRAEWEHLPLDEQTRLLNSAGRPSLGASLHFERDGHILVRTSHDLESYWRDPDTTAEVLADGWLHTGDIGYMQDGILKVIDRRKDLIITGGENVSSAEVENVLVSHPAVEDAAVVGLPDQKWGEAVTAVVVSHPGVTVSADELIRHCRSHLAGYKVPKRVEFCTSLPRTATGKLQKVEIRQQLQLNATASVGTIDS